MFEYEGKAICFGDDINTDYIISSRRKKDTIDPHELVRYLMEDIRPTLAEKLTQKSLFVAGENFGCGSAMEVAAQVVKAAGIPIIIAKSFARSYFRNAINNGILAIQADTSRLCEGDVVHVLMDDTSITISDLTNGYVERQPAPQGKIREILDAGGLIAYVTTLHKEGLHGSN
jgi:3-isopropylmalate/(R)-2-methylmalate dehydratase small subunit